MPSSLDARALLPSRPPFVERVLMRCAGQCAICRSWSERRVCTDCLGRYATPALRCHSCGLRLPSSPTLARRVQCGRCLKTPPPVERCVAALDYQFPWDTLLQRFKYHLALDLREVLAERLLQALESAGVSAPDFIVPVPLSGQRLQERGYNQAHEIAKSLGRRLRLRVEPELVLRLRDTSAQAQLDLDARAANVRGAFAAEPTRLAEIKGARVAVLDDVLTTGATVFEVARVLRQAGAAEVQAWTLARTPEPGT